MDTLSKISQLKKLEKQIKVCTLCELCNYRTNAVASNGVYKTKIMLIGEAPGRNEDLEGLPFVGQAGELLQKMLNTINLSKDQIYITNVVKCRPPDNREPKKEEIDACKPYLFKQIELLDPKLIILVGKYSVNTVLGLNLKISNLKGRVFYLNDRYLFCTYHPAFILRNQSYLEEYKLHFQKIKKILTELKIV